MVPLQHTAESVAALQQHFPAPNADPDINFAMIGMQVLITIWIFVLGSCFGSFLNVVIYRLPAGMSLGKPKSRCPQCETPLAVRDNIPVLGWILLKGKCRYCSLPISPRYPIIEATCGIVFLSLMFVEVLTGAANLPLRHPDHFINVNRGFWLVWFMKWDLLGLFLYHCFLLVTTLAVCMIGYDGHRSVKPLNRFVIGVGLVCGIIWWQLRPVHFHPNSLWVFNWISSYTGDAIYSLVPQVVLGTLDGLAGLLAGTLVGLLLNWQMSSGTNRPLEESAGLRDAVATTMVFSGIFLGWQAVGMLAVVVIPLLGIVKLAAAARGSVRLYRSAAPVVFVVSWMFLLTWNSLHEAPWMIGVYGWRLTALGPWTEWLLTAIGLGCVAAIVRYSVPSHTLGAPDFPGENENSESADSAQSRPVEDTASAE